MLKIDGLLLSGALIVPGETVSPLLIKAATTIGTYLPKLRVQKLNENDISRDPAILAQRRIDPLVYQGGMPARTGAELVRAMAVIRAKSTKMSLPIFVMHGTADKLTNVEGSMQLYSRVESADKTLKLYPDLYHEILNEPEKEQVIADIIAWLNLRAQQTETTRKSHHKTRAKKKKGSQR